MSIESRPEYRAAEIQAEADGKLVHLTPERIAARDAWRQKIGDYIAGRLTLIIDLDVKRSELRGDDETTTSQ